MGTGPSKDKGSGSNATDHCNPWSYARYRLPPHFTRQDVSDIATSLDIAIPHAKNDSQCDAKTAVKRLILGLSREQRSERLYEALVLLYQKGVRIESDSSLMQIVHELSLSRKQNSTGFSAVGMFCSSSDIVTSIERFGPDGDVVRIDLQHFPSVSSKQLAPSKRHSFPELENEHAKGFPLLPEEALHSLRVECSLDNLFNTACHNSHVTVQARNIIVLGQTGAGKTSTVYHLLDMPLPKSPSSTDLIEISSDIYWQHNKSQELRTVTATDEVTGLSKAILANSTLPQTSSPFYTTQQNESSPSAIKTELMERVKLKFCFEITRADLTKKNSLLRKARPLTLYQFIDCGGMPFFRNLLPQFFPNSTTTFLLVHKLTDKLHSNAQIRVLKKGELVYSQQISSDNLKEILSWISIAHSCSGHPSEDNYPTNTLIVGTHYDELLQLCFDDESFADEAATMATEYICRQVVEAPSGCVLDPEPIFLNNLLAGTAGSPGVRKLREKLQSLSLEGKPVTVPMQWGALIVHIRELSKDKKTVVLLLTTYVNIAATYHLGREESMEALEKFEELCLLFRMPAKSYLSNFVFTDLQWLFNSLASVLNPPDTYRKRGAFYRDWQSLQKTGFMSSQLHSHIISRAPVVPHLHQAWISDMLQHLCLLAKLPSPTKGQEYFCPILLPPFINKEDIAKDPFHYCKQVAPLYLCPLTGCVPPGFLARLFTVLACHSDLSLRYCTCQLSATFRFTLKKQPNESYFIRISENKGALQLELCSEYSNGVEYFKVCDVTYPVVNVVLRACRDLRKVWIHSPPFEHPSSLPNSSASFPLLSLQCSDSSCRLQPNFNAHLTQVHLNPLNNTTSYVQCSLNQRRQHLDCLHASQLVWLWEFIEDKSEKQKVKNAIVTVIIGDSYESSGELMLEDAFPYYSCPQMRREVYAERRRKAIPVSLDSGRRQKQQLGRLLAQEERSQALLAATPSPPYSNPSSATVSLSSATVSYTPISAWITGPQHILDRHFDGTLYKHLDLQLRAQLFQHDLLTDEQLLNIARFAETTSDIFSTESLPNPKREALRILVDALKFAGDRGFMGLIAVLRNAADTNGKPSSHRTVLDMLQRDYDYSVIKENWLSSLTMCD